LRPLIDVAHPELSVRRQCQLLGLSRSSLYYQPAGQTAENLRLMRRIDEQYTACPFYGSRKMTTWLNEVHQEEVNRKRVQRLLRLMGLEALYPKPRLSQGGRGQRIYPYLLRGVAIERPDQVWSADITYVPLAAAFTARLLAAGVAVSRDGRGRWLDNVFVERLWRSVKQEDIYLRCYETVAELERGLVRYFGFYNEERFHQSLEYRTLAEVYGAGRIREG
jgi:putative transposase